MKELRVTYHMSRPGETVEDCITLPVSDEAAREILPLKVDKYRFLCGDATARLSVIIYDLALLRGFENYEIRTVEEVTP